MKTCSKCKKEKPVGEFYYESKVRSGLSACCKKCKGLSGAAWTRRNPESKQISHRRSRYGLEPGDYASLLERFGGKCGVCGGSNRIEIDHCHKTGKVRGILCRNCNHALGKFQDSEAMLSRAIEYLRENKTTTQ